MENASVEKKKFNFKFWIPMGIGIFSIIMSILTAIIIYSITPNYALLKNDYDVYKNEESKELETKDYIYYSDHTEDASFFTIDQVNFSINLTALVNDNPSFKTGNYMIDIGFYLKCEFPDYEKYTLEDLFALTKDGEKMKERFAIVNSRTTIEGFTFTDDDNEAVFTFRKSSIKIQEIDYDITVEDIRLMFYALRK